MMRYLISFDAGAMTFPDEDLADVAKASHDVVREAREQGVWIFGAGVQGPDVSVVDTDGSVTANAYPAGKPFVGGFAIVEVPSHDEALRWAARIAAACRCAQDVRELMFDPES